MKFLVFTACIVAFVAYVLSEQCHKDDDVNVVCTLTACPANNTILICAHDECTCAVDPNVPCQMKSDCEAVSGNCEHEHHGPAHKRAPHHGPAKEWHCLDNLCKCF
ncbi:serine protease inhibitor Cvsi-2-like [Argopecten irradians]|uniref:serine protease inhibitor Cvsi-2-like n=1 Tax=Argopecten irradians TaxID=31199 RepID=UPI00371D1BAA